MRYLNIAGYIAIPLAYLVHLWIGRGQAWEPTVTFILAALGVVPLAHLMGESTEQLAEQTGPTWGGLLNATFGNAAELIIAIIALHRGLNEIVMASLTGSILGNLLLVSGAAIVVGGWSREKQEFNRQSAETNAGLLMLAVGSMLFPAIFHFTYQFRDPSLREHEHGVSLGTSVILLTVYGLGLLFTLRTHAHIFSRGPSASPEHPGGISGVHGGRWTVRKSVIILLAASAGIGIVAELLVGSAETMARNLGWNHIFVGVILLAIIGNAAEHSTAVMLARSNDMDTAMTIVYQSSVQIALFATPFLVLVSSVMVAMGLGHAHHLDLIFSPMEVVAVLLTVMIVVVVHINGQTNWFEGVMLLALYAILAIAFFYIPAEPSHG
ncbi:MAG TPA: calcium/proton exchanger [Tepidisphaeraceae bacterium]|jgi:Ca2+:H+ antiporter